MNAINEPQHKDYLARVARTALPRWNIDANAELRLISLSENAMFLVTHGPLKWVLRVHRLGYHSAAGVRSELAGMQALRAEAGVETPLAVPGQDGELVQHVCAAPFPEPRMVVLFDFIAGVQPEPDNLYDAFDQLGAITARMHLHSRQWQRPAFFERQVWDYEGAFGERPIWGHWRAGFARHLPGLELIERADALMRQRLQRYGKDHGRFGLIHTDFRLANLLVAGGEAKVLDFDDCGFGWFLYDVASSTTFIENHADIGSIVAAWVDGYRKVAALDAEDIAEIPTLMMFRRLIILGWAGSHPGTDLAREMGDAYSAETVELAEKYLCGQLLGACQ
ncbi:Stress response kinase A [compost metagenome]